MRTVFLFVAALAGLVFSGGQNIDSLSVRTVRVHTAPPAATYSDSFVVMKNGVLSRRNRAQVLTDIGAEPAFTKNAGFNPTQYLNSNASPTFAGLTTSGDIIAGRDLVAVRNIGANGTLYIQGNGDILGSLDVDSLHSTKGITIGEAKDSVWHAGNFTPPDQALNSTASPTFAGVTVGNNGVTIARIDTNGIDLGNDGVDPALFPNSERGINWGLHSSGLPYYVIRPHYHAYTNALGTLNTSNTRLQLNWATGIEIGAEKAYGGTRFYNGSPGIDGTTQIMSIGDGDDNVRIESDLYVKHDKIVYHSGNLTPAAIGAAPAIGEFEILTYSPTVQTPYYINLASTYHRSFLIRNLNNMTMFLEFYGATAGTQIVVHVDYIPNTDNYKQINVAAKVSYPPNITWDDGRIITVLNRDQGLVMYCYRVGSDGKCYWSSYRSL